MYIKVISEFEDGSELVSKRLIMEMYNTEESAVIGDGISDLSMVRDASIVFARSTLAMLLEERQVSFEHWDNFYDIRAYLANKWK